MFIEIFSFDKEAFGKLWIFREKKDQSGRLSYIDKIIRHGKSAH